MERAMRDLGVRHNVVILATAAALMAAPCHGEEGQRYAFLVACKKYKEKTGLLPLQYTHNDILDFEKALLNSGFQEKNITLMYEGQTDSDLFPEKRKIEEQLRGRLRSLGPDDSLIVAFSGHGVEFEKDKRNFFCPLDAQVDDRDTLIDLRAVYDELESCQAKRKLLIVDACRNDPTNLAKNAREKVHVGGIDIGDVPKGIVALFSCSPGQKSYEDKELKHSIFFHCLLECWNGAAYDGKGKLGVDQLVNLTVQKTKKAAWDKLKVEQHPQKREVTSGSWDLNYDPVGFRKKLEGHGLMVTAVIFCRDGHRAISAGYDRSIRLWDVGTGTQLKCFTGHKDQVNGLALAADDSKILSGGVDKTLRLWDMKTGTELLQVKAVERGGVRCVALSQDGSTGLSGGDDGVIRLWDLKDAKVKAVYRGHRGTVYSVALSPDGRHVLTGGEDAKVRLWGVETGKEQRCFEGHEQRVYSVAFAPGNQPWILSGSADRTVRLWERTTGTMLKEMKGHLGDVTSVAFSPDGTRAISAGCDNTIRLWDLDTGREQTHFEERAKVIRTVAYSPDGRGALSGGEDGMVRFYRLPRN
jgi:WD40 repeat protein